MNRIFILASERSGTNLIRSLLGKHKNICAPVAPHLLNFFSSIIYYYGNLNLINNKQRLFNDISKHVNHHFNDWNLNFSFDKVKKIENINLVKFVDLFYQQKSKKENKQSYFSKGIHQYDFVADILINFPNAKFVYLHRDPRDHVASWLRRPLFLHSAFETAVKWKQEQKKILQLCSSYKSSIIKISYEDLISNTKKEIGKILNFVEEEIDENCFTTDLQNKEASRNEFWKNIAKPIDSNNLNTYLNYLSKSQILTVEWVCKNYMDALNYKYDKKNISEYNKPFLFGVKELITKKISKIKNKEIINKRLYSLKEKINLENKITNEIIENFSKKISK